MSANIIDLHIEKGTDFRYKMKLKLNDVDLDLGDYTFRSSVNSNGTVVSITVVEDSDGGVILSLTSSQTSLLTRGVAIYDLEMVNDETGKVIRVIKGRIFIDDEVTV
jgi:hypothetical protein